MSADEAFTETWEFWQFFLEMYITSYGHFPLHHPSSSPSSAEAFLPKSFLILCPIIPSLLCVSVPLNLIRIACISMGPGYLREHGQVISEHTTKFTPSSSSSRCLKFKVGHGALSPSSLSDAMLCRSYVDNHSYSRSVSTRPEDQMHSTAHLMTLRFFLPPPLQIFFKKLEVFLL